MLFGTTQAITMLLKELELSTSKGTAWKKLHSTSLCAILPLSNVYLGGCGACRMTWLYYNMEISTSQ